MNEVVVRRYEAADFEAFIAAQSLSFRRLATGVYGREALEAVERARNTPERKREMLTIHELVAVGTDGRILGAAGFTPFDAQPHTARIRRVFVHPDHAGRGLGTRLVSEVEALAHASRLSRFVVSASLNAVPFYQKLGYRRLRPDPRRYGELVVEFVFMGK